MKVIAATNNPGKLREFSRILQPIGIQVISLSQAGIVSNPEETGKTFEENAAIKARAVYEKTHLACLADDSGLCVDALNGEPGVYTSRYAGENATDSQNNQKLLKKLENVKNRSARFVCAICLILENGEEITSLGVCEGTIAKEPSGENGFGYDPVFQVNGVSYATLSPEEKDKISHRGQALVKLVNLLKEREQFADK